MTLPSWIRIGTLRCKNHHGIVENCCGKYKEKNKNFCFQFSSGRRSASRRFRCYKVLRNIRNFSGAKNIAIYRPTDGIRRTFHTHISDNASQNPSLRTDILSYPGSTIQSLLTGFIKRKEMNFFKKYRAQYMQSCKNGVVSGGFVSACASKMIAETAHQLWIRPAKICMKQAIHAY